MRRSSGSGRSGVQKCRLFTLNNESAELHEYRVATFQLDTIFQGFLPRATSDRSSPTRGST